MIGRETVEVFPREEDDPATDRNGKPRWRFPEVGTPVRGCAFSEGASDEPLEVGRNATISDAQLLAPVGTAVSEHDRVRARGRMYEVDGQPQEWRSRTMSRRPGLVVNLNRVEG